MMYLIAIEIMVIGLTAVWLVGQWVNGFREVTKQISRVADALENLEVTK